jgi:Ca2+:H+ antiporter
MSFVASGLVRPEQDFNKDGAGASTSCLLVAGTGVAIPTLFVSSEFSTDAVLLSRYCAIIMAFVYVCFIIFQLFTHTDQFEDHSGGSSSSPVKRGSFKEEMDAMGSKGKRLSHIMGVTMPIEEEETYKSLSPISATIVLLSSTLIIAQLSELMVGSIEDVTEEYGVPKSFIGLILLPIVGNAAEHMTAVVAAFKGKMDLAIGVAVGSSTQIALLVVPFAVMIGWYFDQPMSLGFGPFLTGVFLLAVFLVTSCLTDGTSTWFEGVLLIGVYLMIAMICWFLPNEGDHRMLGTMDHSYYWEIRL